MREEIKASGNVIEVTNLAKAYGRVKALDSLTFSVSKGEVVGFLGPNGAGKSTTMRILCGLSAADAGEAMVNGVDLAKEEGEVRRHVGYLPEDNPLPEDLRVSEYLRFRARLKGLSGGLLQERIDATLNLCDLRRTAAERLIGNLSKGFRQRVGLAEALLAEPKLMILDEPTIGLDPRQTSIVRRLLDRLRGETTFLVSSHVLSEIESSCDRILIINRGRIVASGTLAELQSEYVEKISVVIISGSNPDVIEQIVKETCNGSKLIEKSPKDSLGQQRLSFDIKGDYTNAKKILVALVENDSVEICEFSHSKPNLESIFLKATKRSWKMADTAKQDLKEVSATPQPEEEISA
tara:strand:- start:652 stop:1704 length:1053 start_codon:yes stop_codon:yes gene_type:complete